MKTIQVPVDGAFLEKVNAAAHRRFRNRSEFIRTACEFFIRHLEEEKKDEQYARGYRRTPETLGLAKTSACLGAQVIGEKKW